MNAPDEAIHWPADDSAAAAQLRLVVWCKAYGHWSEPDPAEQARWYGRQFLNGAGDWFVRNAAAVVSTWW